MLCKADDAGGSAPAKEENAAGREILAKLAIIFELVDYI